MNHRSASLLYRRASVQQASPAGLAIALCDILVADLQQAVACIHSGSIEGRSNALLHGFQVLAQLDAQVDRANGGVAAANLVRFYEHLRRSMLGVQFSPREAALHALIAQILQVRGAWQQVDARQPEAAPLVIGEAPEHALPLAFSCSA